jgi:hypothetical protein
MPVSLEETITCSKCGKKFEVVGEDNGNRRKWHEVPCPYLPCIAITKFLWPDAANFLRRKIPSEMNST